MQAIERNITTWHPRYRALLCGLIAVGSWICFVDPAHAVGTVPAGYSASWPPGATYGIPPHSWSVGGSTAIYPATSSVCTDPALLAYLNAYWSYTPIQNIFVQGTAASFSCHADFWDINGTYYHAINYAGAYVSYHAGCPTHSTNTGGGNCTCDTNFTPDAAGTSCVSDCPIPGLLPLTDPIANLYDNGTYNSTDKPDLIHLTQATQTGLACIQQKVAALNCYMTPRPTSGYRPTAYQDHIRDVYDKWMAIKDNNSTECAARKNIIKDQFDVHSPFARRPGTNSNHSQLDAGGNPAGNAVDITGVPDNALNSADAIAAQCNMYRPLINMPNPKDNDPVHYQAR